MKIKNPCKVAIILALLNSVFIALHLLLQYLYINDVASAFVTDAALRFNMDAEATIPTWFATILLFATAQILFYIGYKVRSDKRYWFGLSAIAFYLSIDEASEIHEMLIEPMQSIFGITSGPLFFAWIIPVISLLILLAVVFARFFWRLDRRTMLLLILAGFFYVAGALGMEMISGAYWESQDFVYDFTYRIFNSIEEGLENFGTITAIYALLSFIKTKKI